MIAAGSVIAAAHGILGRSWTESFHLVTKLQHITSVDAVRCQCFTLYFHKPQSKTAVRCSVRQSRLLQLSACVL